VLARFLLDDGVSPMHLSQMRATISALLLMGILLAVGRGSRLRIAREDVPRMAWFGIAGLALVNATYYAAIDRLAIGVALVIQYLAPLGLLVWLRVAHGRRPASSLWGAVGLSLVGCVLVVRAYDAGDLDGVGVLFAFASMVTFAIYLVAGERAGHRYDPFTTAAWAFGFAALFWLVVRPPWTFPWGEFDSARNLTLGLAVVVIGTLVPFLLEVAALRHLPASRVGVVATLEPVLGALLAWPVHGEVLAAPQIAGGLVVVAAVAWVQARPPVHEIEGVPAYAPVTTR
jgi:drug/metabolite transporter (DMT)-like permease